MPERPKSDNAPYVDDDFILNRIERAHIGLLFFKVTNKGKFYAALYRGKYTYENGKEKYSGARTLKAATNIFMGLVNKYQNFECDNIRYYRNRHNGKWYWVQFNKPS